ncbi:MAG: hexitol phosphatase HxpB [Acidiferrobacterales bacterium]
MKAAIFDMDGVLIDSEPFWRRAEKEVFGQVGVRLSDEMCEQTMGYRIDDVVAHWYQRQPWQGKSLRQVEAEITSKVVALIRGHGLPMDGVYEILHILKENDFRLGLASSSSMMLIDATVEKLRIRAVFDAVCTATEERAGKPDPAVYLTAANRLGVESKECIVFEDSISGVRAAKAADMWTVAIPPPNLWEDHRFDAADLKLRSLQHFKLSMLG